LDSYLATIRTCIWMWPGFQPLLHAKKNPTSDKTQILYFSSLLWPWHQEVCYLSKGRVMTLKTLPLQWRLIY
jgi:hypothetical protein